MIRSIRVVVEYDEHPLGPSFDVTLEWLSATDAIQQKAQGLVEDVFHGMANIRYALNRGYGTTPEATDDHPA